MRVGFWSFKTALAMFKDRVSPNAPLDYDATQAFLDSLFETVKLRAIAHINETIASLNISAKHSEEYRESFSIDRTGDGVSITFAPKSPLIEAIEEGSSPYSLKEALLSKNFEVSKNGHKYRIIPLETKEKEHDFRTINGTDVDINDAAQVRAIETLQKVSQALKMVRSTSEDGVTKITSEQTRNYQNVDTGHLYKSTVYRLKVVTNTPKTSAVEDRFLRYRTVSDKPGTAKWEHPGFVGVRLLSETTDWYMNNRDNFVTEVIASLK